MKLLEVAENLPHAGSNYRWLHQDLSLNYL